MGGGGRVARAHLAGPLARLAMVSYSPRHHLFILIIFYFLIHFLCCSLSDDDDDVDIKEEEEKRSKKKKKNLSKHHKSPAFSAPAHQQIISKKMRAQFSSSSSYIYRRRELPHKVLGDPRVSFSCLTVSSPSSAPARIWFTGGRPAESVAEKKIMPIIESAGMGTEYEHPASGGK